MDFIIKKEHFKQCLIDVWLKITYFGKNIWYFNFFKDFEEKLMRFETKDINATESVWLSATPSNR